MRFVLMCLMLVVLAGCQTRVNLHAGSDSVRSVPVGTTVSSTRVQLSGNAKLGMVLVIGVMLADGIRYFRVDADGTRTPLDRAPSGLSAPASAATTVVAPRVSVQDCTRPVDLQAGNLICR